MKKIISLMVALMMVMSAVPAFATVAASPNVTLEVDNTNPSKLYFNNFDSIANGVGTSDFLSPDYQNKAPLTGTDISLNSDGHCVDYEIKDGTFTVSRSYAREIPEGTKLPGKDTAFTAYKQGIFYFNYATGKSYTQSILTFGYDITFSNFNAPTEEGASLFIAGLQPGAENPVLLDNGTTKTAWCFFGDSTRINFTGKYNEETKEDKLDVILDENDKPAIFLGNAKLNQDEKYTFKVQVNSETKTWKAFVIDSEGNLLDGVSGKTSNAFVNAGLGKAELPLQLEGVKVTFDNIFVESSSDIDIPDEIEPTVDGKISFKATIPDGIEDAALYINDTKVDDLDLTPGAVDYNITAALPEGTAFGDLAVSIRGTLGDADFSVNDTVKLTKLFKKAIDLPDWNKTAVTEGEDTYYDIADTRLTLPTNLEGGRYEFGMKFKIKAGGTSASMRFVSNIVKPEGYANMVAFGAFFENHSDNAKDSYYTWNLGPYGEWFKNSNTSSENWNDASIILDYRDASVVGNRNYDYTEGGVQYKGTSELRPYSLTVNGITHDGTFRMAPHATYNGFNSIGVNNVKFKDTYLNEIVTTDVKGVTATYADGTSATDEFTAYGLNKLTFAFEASFDNADYITFVDENGNEITGASIALDGNNVVVTLPADDIVAGDLKLIVGKDTVAFGSVLGANIEAPVTISNDSCILSPEENASFENNEVNLSAYVPNADKVAFYVNDECVSEFDPEADAVYETEYTAEEMGSKVFDVYAYTSEGVEITSTTFSTTEATESLVQSNPIESALSTAAGATGALIDAAGHDGSKAYQVTSKLGTDVNGDGSINNDESNSGITELSPGKNLYRKMVTTFEMKPGANTIVTTEIGFMLDGEVYPGVNSAYRTYYPRGGSSNPVFSAKTNKILGTEVTYTADTWYKLEQLVDWDNMVCKWYVYADVDKTNPDYETLIVSTSDSISGFVNATDAAKFPNWKEDIVTTQKFKLLLKPADYAKDTATSQAAVFTIDNFRRYQPETLPEFKDVESNIIEAGTDELTFALTRAYDFADGDVNSLVAENIEVYVNGEEFAATAEIIDGANFKVSGLAGVKAGSTIDIKVSDAAFFNGNLIGKYLTQRFYVVDDNGLCVLPLNRDANNGGKFGAKYINLGGSVEAYLSLAKLDGLKLAGASFETITFESGITGYVASKDACDSAAKLRLWTKGLAPIAPQATFEAIAE